MLLQVSLFAFLSDLFSNVCGKILWTEISNCCFWSLHSIHKIDGYIALLVTEGKFKFQKPKPWRIGSEKHIQCTCAKTRKSFYPYPLINAHSYNIHSGWSISLSQSCAVAKSEKLWRAIGQSNLVQSNSWLQQNLPKFCFWSLKTAVWPMEQSSILPAKFDCPVACQNFSLIHVASACDCKTQSYAVLVYTAGNYPGRRGFLSPRREYQVTDNEAARENLWLPVMRISLSCYNSCQSISRDRLTSNQ